jgi:hypothetical protein
MKSQFAAENIAIVNEEYQLVKSAQDVIQAAPQSKIRKQNPKIFF